MWVIASRLMWTGAIATCRAAVRTAVRVGSWLEALVDVGVWPTIKAATSKARINALAHAIAPVRPVSFGRWPTFGGVVDRYLLLESRS
jgi:hypothetical protein